MAHNVRLPLFYLFLCFFGGFGEKHECDRLCLENETPKRCFYQFSIGISQRKNVTSEKIYQKLFITINQQWPGPIISVCQNDTIIVDVKNKLPFGMETSIHWHGLVQEDSPFMDGVPMITQCPILPRTTFRYQITASKSGSFYYHAHSVSQQLDGIYGPLIVHNKKDQSHSSRIVTLSPVIEKIQVLQSGLEADLNITGLWMEVYDSNASHSKNQQAQRLRVINAAALDCPIRIFTHTVLLKVVAVDGNEVKHTGVNEIFLYPGERVDLLVKPEVMKVTHIVGQNLCKGHTKYGFDPGLSEKSIIEPDDLGTYVNELYEKLEPKKSDKLEPSDLKIFIPFDVSVFKDFKGDVDFRYKLGAITPYAPSLLAKETSELLQVNKMSFLYPHSPLLSQPNDVPEDLFCGIKEQSDRCISNNNGFCECLQVINLPYNRKIDLFLINEGRNSNTSQTIHIHGHTFYVLSVKAYNKPVSGDEIEKEEARGVIKRNLVNPIRKDTISVPNKGYVVLRLNSDNQGKWLLESIPSKAKTSSGLELILNVENPSRNESPPKGFPVCGTMKEPDMVFSSD